VEFYAILDQVLALLRRRGRVTYLGLKLEFGLDDTFLEGVKQEILFTRVARDEQGLGLSWTGGRRCLKGVDVLLLMRVSEAEFPNAIAWHHDDPGPALSQLSRDRHRPTWPDPSRQATGPGGWWHGMEHPTAQGWGEVVGPRQEALFVRWQARWQPCGSTQCATDGWGAAERHLDAEQHHVGQENTHEASSDGHTPILSRKACLAESES
jgi:hypothetical protein